MKNVHKFFLHMLTNVRVYKYMFDYMYIVRRM